MSNVKTNIPGLIRGQKAQGAVGAALLAAARAVPVDENAQIVRTPSELGIVLVIR